MDVKRCSKCKEIKPSEVFGKDRSKKDGLNCSCRACLSVVDKFTRRTGKPPTYALMEEREALHAAGNKRCSECQEVKPFEAFNRNKSRKDGLQYACKACRSALHQEYYSDNREAIAVRMKIYNQENKEVNSARGKQYRKVNHEAVLERHRRYREDNQEDILQRAKVSYQANRETVSVRRKALRANLAVDRPFHKMRQTAVTHHLDKGRTDLITVEQIEALYHEQGGLCAYSGDPMPLETLPEPHHPFAPSLERLDCKVGHTEANCVLVRRHWNNARKNLCLKTFLSYLDSEVARGYIRCYKVVKYLSTLG